MITTHGRNAYRQCRKHAVDNFGYRFEQSRTENLGSGETAQERHMFDYRVPLSLRRKTVSYSPLNTLINTNSAL